MSITVGGTETVVELVNVLEVVILPFACPFGGSSRISSGLDHVCPPESLVPKRTGPEWVVLTPEVLLIFLFLPRPFVWIGLG
jgi:hypothetical protein